MNNENATVYIVDDDPSVRHSLSRLLRSFDYHVESFFSAQDFFDLGFYKAPCCLILDVIMPGMNGLDVQEKLVSLAIIMPIIFITGNATIPMSVHVIKAGAVNFLEKPFDPDELVAEVEKAIQLSMQLSNEKNEMSAITQHIDSLTPRENEVFKLVIKGKMNKQIAAELGVCEKTIKVHRARVMEKMNVKSLAELVHLSDSVSVV
ncbi:MAG: response regulator transcription factor [Gammaproteobacteria bacterium]|nr:response regulator transcription factor [Gammaproteobacteria bacterium]